METPRMGRRQLLQTGGGMVTALVAGGCDFLSTEPARESESAGGPDPEARQAPQLAELARRGELPDLGQRLPSSPLVVQPVERRGHYGGQWRNALRGASDAYRLTYTLAYENLVRWDLAWEEVTPNIAESFEVSKDGRQFTFHLRAGMRWSDGEPFDADDILFAYQDLLTNEQVSPVVDPIYTSNGRPAEAERIDGQTVRFTFAQPNGLFLEQIACEVPNMLTCLPRHYLASFHKKYSPDADAAATEKGYEGWQALLQEMVTPSAGMWHDPNLPRLHAWLPQSAVGDTSRLAFERNPYYWKTDPDGRQLPYLDTVVFDTVGSHETLLLRVVRGDVDMIDRHINTPENKPVLARNRESGGYRFFDLVSDKLNTTTIMLNLTCKDPVKRAVFNNRDFRIGLSYAINRADIIAGVHNRQGEPWQAAPHESTPFYSEKMSKQFTEYDVARANAHLDRVLPDKDGNGVRLGPDGQPFTFSIEAASDAGKPQIIQALEMVERSWRQVGIDVALRSESLTLFSERTELNQHDAAAWDGDGGLSVVLTPPYYFPYGSYASRYATEWARWYESNGEQGERPPEAPRRQMQLYDQIRTERDQGRRHELMKEILEISAEEFYTIGISSAPPGYGVVKNTFRNMVSETFFAALFPYPGATMPEQYFFDEAAG